jgi:lysophospholipase L1-like esterase
VTKHDIINNGSLVVGSIVLFFLVAEVALRVTGLQTVNPNPPLIYQTSSDPRISIELIPEIKKKTYREIVTTNSLGFRGPELDPNKPTIAVLGDSITFGYGLKDRETLSTRLNERLPDYNVLNTAAPAYQLPMQTATYETKVRPLDPAALMLVFYWNDFTTATPFLDDDNIVRAEGWVPTEEECYVFTDGVLQWIPGQCWLDRHSAFYKAFKKLVTMRTGMQHLQEQREQSQQEPQEDSVTMNDLQTYAGQLDQLARLLPATMPRIFVIWPDRYVHEWSRPRLRALAEQRGFTVIDLYDTFGNEVPVLGWDTVHPNAAAVEQAATVIAPVLKDAL